MNEWWKTANGSTLEECYHRLCKEKSDINQHLPKLRQLASQCSRVTDFGVRNGASTVTMLAAQPDNLHCYDFRTCPVVSVLSRLAGRTHFEFHNANILMMPPIAPTDFLFSDTKHTEGQVWTELTRHGDAVCKWIGFHDSYTFGETGSDPGTAGIMVAIRRWLKCQPQWHIIYQAQNNNGLVVLERSSH